MKQEDFETRYKLKPKRLDGSSLIKAYEKTSLKNLEMLKNATFRPKVISYYEEILATDKREKELKDFKGIIVGSFCNFTPEELIYATSSLPIRLCAGFYDSISLAEEVLPRDICPLVKSSFGFKVAGVSYFELCNAVILPTPCDPKKKLGEVLSDYIKVIVLRLPQDKLSFLSKNFWLNQIKLLKERLEELTSNKITKDRLRYAIELLGRRQTIFRRLYQIRKKRLGLLNERDFMMVIQTSFCDDINRWLKKTEELCNELDNQKLEISDKRIKLLLTGAPIIWPNYKLLNIIENMNAVVVIDELCSGTRHLYDCVEVDDWSLEGMLRAIANRYLLASTCPCFIESNDRIDKLLQMIDDFCIDGVIHHSLRLCQIYDMELNRIRRVLKDKGVSFLSIHTDYTLEDIEQIRTRIEAFLEMLKDKKR